MEVEPYSTFWLVKRSTAGGAFTTLVCRWCDSTVDDEVEVPRLSANGGVHFSPMSICFGPRFAVLGVACMANAALGLLASAVPCEFSVSSMVL
jgi:hypothetical protein